MAARIAFDSMSEELIANEARKKIIYRINQEPRKQLGS
jgi:hypothetical protein